MPDYDFAGLSPRSFEHLVQALALKILGPHVRVFGDGPDGQREATFEGRLLYPDPQNPWDGYGVIQAKFRQRPLGTSEDGPWALEQLEKELKGFADGERRLRKPQYYVFATNVVLGPAHEAGAKDKAASLIESYRERLGLLDYALWDYDQLCRFVDGDHDIRRRYAFITSGDVLAAMMEYLKDLQPDFAGVMSRYLQKDLLAEQFVRLEQAGHAHERKISLANVFIDLPAFADLRLVPPDEKRNALPGGFAQEILAAGQEKLTPSGRPTLGPEQTEEPPQGRFVLVGGPGQGKTTVGQHICQAYRAAILKDREPTTLLPEVRDALEEVIVGCQRDGIELPKARRFPVRVPLSALADELASTKPDAPKSLFSFILRRIGDRAERPLREEDLHRWLGEYPWLIVLDGLDEVPSTSNRQAVLDSIQGFLVDAAESSGDVLVVATTRPQGYSDDFSPRYYAHRYLAPLSPARALYYGHRLAENRYRQDADTLRLVCERLERAAAEPATARLMQSPLQVTIMVALVSRVGTPPQDRYPLFRDYYRVIYDRERERDIPRVSEVLAKFKTHVDAIHRTAALRLQIQSQSAGDAQAGLTADDFRQLVRTYLKDGPGYEGADLEQLSADIIEASLNRLVFLVGVEQGRIGFEIRSLQEYMAADALMEGAEEHVRARLPAIAPLPFWRNVFLFAAGRCLAEQTHYGDTLVTICDQLDDEDAASKTIRAGARLALELLEDGMARTHPKYARSLARIALRLLDLPPGPEHKRLAAVTDNTITPQVREALELHLGQEDYPQTLGAWSLLRHLIRTGTDWALGLADARWPRDPERQADILSREVAAACSDWDLAKLESATPQLPVSNARRLVECLGARDEEVRRYSCYPHLAALGRLGRAIDRHRENTLTIPIVAEGAREIGLGLHVVSVGQRTTHGLKAFLSVSASHLSWLPLVAAARFAEEPGKATLARELKTIADAWVAAGAMPGLDGVRWIVRKMTPWPFSACFWYVHSAEDLQRIAGAVAEGDLGDLGQWQAAEGRWIKSGVTIEDLRATAACEQPFGREVAEIGFTTAIAEETLSSGFTATQLSRDWLINTIVGLPSSVTRSMLAHCLLTALGMPFTSPIEGFHFSDVAQLRAIVLDAYRYQGSSLFLRILTYLPWKSIDDQWISLLDDLGRRVNWYHFVGENPDSVSALWNLANANPERLGLLAMLAPVAAWHPSLAKNLYPVKPAQIEDKRLRWMATLLRLVQHDWSEQEGKTLAGIAAEFGENAVGFMDVLERLKEHRDEDRSFLMELAGRLPGEAWRARARVVGLLQEHLNRRAANFGDPETLRRLGLA